MPENNDYIIEVKGVSKLYGPNKSEAARLMKLGYEKDDVYKKTGTTVALWDVNLKIKRGEIYVIIGLSGSGKSTIVRCLNRLHKPTSGQILFEGNDLMKFNKKEILNFRREKASMVFQSFGLMSHRDILGNVSYGLEVRGVPKEERKKIAMDMISMVGLEDLENQSCDSLSGGMQQRVGIARALTSDPEVLLMDEPFSALDPLVRRDMQFELLQIQRKLEKTVVFITHDLDEAFKLGDTVAIMRDGKVIQIDAPEDMSANPADEYVSRFIEGADKSKVVTVSSVMITPSIIRATDTPSFALAKMRKNGLSTVYVVDDKLRLLGIVTLHDALRAHSEKLTVNSIIQKDIPVCHPDSLISDIMPIAAEAAYPIAVVDEGNVLKGIVTKANVLTSLV